ncbi:uncharacterized protein LOC113209901 [Frankliniella occidentalis]|uniref:Uncharacterized protein LOC113209901 n=1 Tax=Frankliniella occidentalis TaxID=133901 RepID=A0A9C6U2W0_FRAOC|nr:uncharacterized protein LOC113209901 [Frankliniella occidentalis]
MATFGSGSSSTSPIKKRSRNIQNSAFSFGSTPKKLTHGAPGTPTKVDQNSSAIVSEAILPQDLPGIGSSLRIKSSTLQTTFPVVSTPTKPINSAPGTPTKDPGFSQSINLDSTIAAPAVVTQVDQSLISKSPSVSSITRNLQLCFDKVSDTSQQKFPSSPAFSSFGSQRKGRLSLSQQSCSKNKAVTAIPLVRDGDYVSSHVKLNENKVTKVVNSLVHNIDISSDDVHSDCSLSPDFKKKKKKKLSDQKKAAEPVSDKQQERTNRQSETFSCAQCQSTFSRKDNLLRHKKICFVSSKKKSKCLFADCEQKFFQRGPLIAHLKEKHDQKIVPSKTFHFESEKAFNLWKDDEEVRSFSYFSKNSGAKGNKIYLYCQHDGSGKAHRRQSEPDRKTSRKVRIGQIKTGNICIARMIVTHFDTGNVEVKYFATHSHPLSRHDFAHHPPTTEKNEEINSKIALGVPALKIWETAIN